jgi:formate dehydrogenase major subunit
MGYASSSEIMDEIAATTPTFAGVSFDRLDREGSLQWPCNDEAPDGTRTMHTVEFTRGKGRFVPTPYVPTRERSTRKFPLILTTGRILAHYNVGAQTRRTDNVAWHPADTLEIHPHDAEVRGIGDGDEVKLTSRVGEITGANVVTTENSDWATNCPEYKVTAVQVGLAHPRVQAERAAEDTPSEVPA